MHPHTAMEISITPQPETPQDRGAITTMPDQTQVSDRKIAPAVSTTTIDFGGHMERKTTVMRQRRRLSNTMGNNVMEKQSSPREIEQVRGSVDNKASRNGHNIVPRNKPTKKVDGNTWSHYHDGGTYKRWTLHDNRHAFSVRNTATNLDHRRFAQLVSTHTTSSSTLPATCYSTRVR